MENRKGRFVVIDGMDGSGKGTQIDLLKKKLKGVPTLFTREPGGSPLAERFRKILLAKKSRHKRTPASDFFLFWSARASHVEDVITPALQKGTHVISDRYYSSSIAFQIFGEERRDELEALFYGMLKNLPGEYHPNLFLFLDLPPEVAFERRSKDASQEKSRFDLKDIEYHRRVREGFKEFATWLNTTGISAAALIDANRSPEEMHENIGGVVERFLNC